MRVKKVEVKIKSSNPSPNQTNPQPQPKINNSNPQIEAIVEEVLRRYLQQNVQQNSQQKQNNLSNSNNNEFIVKANMKSSIIALKVENLLVDNKRVVMSALGYGIVPLIDAVLLIQKDMARRNVKVNIDGIELFEKTVETITGKNKVISGVRVTLSI